VVFDTLAIVDHAHWNAGYKFKIFTQNLSKAAAPTGHFRVGAKKHSKVARKARKNPNTLTEPIAKVADGQQMFLCSIQNSRGTGEER